MGIETDFATRMTPVTIQKSRVHIKTTEAHLTLQRSKKNHRTNVCLNAYVRTYVRTYVRKEIMHKNYNRGTGDRMERKSSSVRRGSLIG